jgi:EmrB/QacA subfamily drug resistance transporter
VLINACVITFMGTLDGSIVNIALPTIAGSFSVGIAAVQWVVTSYLIVASALLLVWGRLSDIHGRRRFFAAGLAIFTIGSLLCGLSNSLPALVASRVLQAIGSSMSMALVQGIVTSTFPPTERGKALGYIGAVVAIGSLVGPSLGGILVQAAGWRSIFFVNVPIGVLGVILTFAVMPESKSANAGRFDSLGATLFFFAISAFFGGLLAFQEGVLSAGVSMGIMALGIAFLLAFLRTERRPDPLVDPDIFKNRVFKLGVIESCLSYMAMFSYTFFMPFYLQSARGLTVLQAGAMMSIYPVATAVLAPLAGSLSDRITYRPLAIAGQLMNGIGLALLATLGGGSPLVLVGANILLLGIGGACFQSPNNSSVMGSVPRERLGIAGSLNSFFRNLGMVAGTTLAVSLFSFATKAGIDEISAGKVDAALFLSGFRVVVLVASALAFAGMALELGGRSRRRLAKAEGQGGAN